MKKELLLTMLAMVAVSFLLTACHVGPHGSHGPHGGVIVNSPPPHATPAPPPHAKAYGHRSRYHYHYYPDVSVYFDTGRSVYFYLQDGSWTLSAALPTHLRISLGERVSLEMEIDRPYLEYDDHRKKYPGKHEKKDKNKGKKEKKDKKNGKDERDD